MYEMQQTKKHSGGAFRALLGHNQNSDRHSWRPGHSWDSVPIGPQIYLSLISARLCPNGSCDVTQYKYFGLFMMVSAEPSLYANIDTIGDTYH